MLGRTQFEGWLSLQEDSSEGLRHAPAARRRATTVCLHLATAGSEDVKMLEMWADKTPEEAHEILKKPDVAVTNLKDKDKQLEKVKGLNDDVRSAWDAAAANSLRLGGTQAAYLPVGFSEDVLRAAD